MCPNKQGLWFVLLLYISSYKCSIEASDGRTLQTVARLRVPAINRTHICLYKCFRPYGMLVGANCGPNIFFNGHGANEQNDTMLTSATLRIAGDRSELTA